MQHVHGVEFAMTTDWLINNVQQAQTGLLYVAPYTSRLSLECILYIVRFLLTLCSLCYRDDATVNTPESLEMPQIKGTLLFELYLLIHFILKAHMYDQLNSLAFIAETSSMQFPINTNIWAFSMK